VIPTCSLQTGKIDRLIKRLSRINLMSYLRLYQF
jgi:hypothetical protein